MAKWSEDHLRKKAFRGGIAAGGMSHRPWSVGELVARAQITDALSKLDVRDLLVRKKRQVAAFNFYRAKLTQKRGPKMVRIPDVDVPAVVLAYAPEAPNGS